MKFEFKARFTAEVIHTQEIPDDTPETLRCKVALELAVKARANLAGANLADAYLAGAYLADAYLADAYLADAYLADANLARAYLAGAYLAGAYLAGAYLADAYLAGANLADAYLADANLARAYLADANLAGAENVGDFTMADGLMFSEYLESVVPALLTAGGKTVKEIVDTGAWDCHSWENCPMHVAFGINRTEDGPPLLRARIKEFITFFDAGLIPKPDVTPETVG